MTRNAGRKRRVTCNRFKDPESRPPRYPMNPPLFLPKRVQFIFIICLQLSFMCQHTVFMSECEWCWLFQGGENNAEDLSPTNQLACDDSAQLKILGLRRESLYTDGLDWVRPSGCSLLFCPCWVPAIKLLIMVTAKGDGVCCVLQVSAGLLKLWGAVGAACTETPSETTISPNLRYMTKWNTYFNVRLSPVSQNNMDFVSSDFTL